MENISIQGIKVIESPFLPIEETVKASCIETKKEVDILTGNLIHVFTMVNEKTILVSKAFYKQLSEKYKFA